MRISDGSSDVCSSDLSLCAVHKDHAFQASSPKLKAALRGGFFFRHPLPWMARHTIGDSLLGKLLICRSACGPARPAIATPARGPDKDAIRVAATGGRHRSEEHTSELQSLMRISYA